ncbi:hypothetical protein DRF67_18565 [Chryseobacterium pennipullorum]|uniref:Uncharacterized protein n=1 Tax=Chryseobacterium pennipullorum TaxID=2258963 RepID=A0A3D9ARZ7_9FLAO|nr:hypothetical protein DRF67_18565 [Chryseobacterium pennipullorum]
MNIFHRHEDCQRRFEELSGPLLYKQFFNPFFSPIKEIINPAIYFFPGFVVPHTDKTHIKTNNNIRFMSIISLFLRHQNKTQKDHESLK